MLLSRPVVVTAFLAVGTALWWAWILATSDAKIAPGLLEGPERKHVVVELRFSPEKFHMLRLQEVGRIQVVEDRRIHLLDVAPPHIKAFARHYWVKSIGVSSRAIR